MELLGPGSIEDQVNQSKTIHHGERRLYEPSLIKLTLDQQVPNGDAARPPPAHKAGRKRVQPVEVPASIVAASEVAASEVPAAVPAALAARMGASDASASFQVGVSGFTLNSDSKHSSMGASRRVQGLCLPSFDLEFPTKLTFLDSTSKWVLPQPGSASRWHQCRQS